MSNEDGQEPSIYAQSLASGKTTAGRLPCDRGVTFAWRARARKEARRPRRLRSRPARGFARSVTALPARALFRPRPARARTASRREDPRPAARFPVQNSDCYCRPPGQAPSQLRTLFLLAARPGVTLRRTLPARRGETEGRIAHQ